MRRVKFGIIALAAAALAMVSAGEWIDNTAQAQTPSLAPQNVQAKDGANLGEVIVTWDTVARAKYYRIGYVSLAELRALPAGRDWTEAYFFVNVKNTGQTEYTIKRLEPGVFHYFIVSGMASEWDEDYLTNFGFAQLTPQSAAPGDYDADNDGLIEISDLAQLDAMRYDTDGNGNVSDEDYVAYTQAFTGAIAGMGCPIRRLPRLRTDRRP